jgi:enoyl-CoA hydratase
MDVQQVDGATIVRVDNPPVNAVDLELLNTVVATIEGLDGPVVLTGTGKCFSAGVDLRAVVEGGPDYTDCFLGSLSAALLALFDYPWPVVAAVNGHAIAGGCVMAMAADVRLMSAGRIGLTELAAGVPFPVVPLEISRYAMGASVSRAALQADTVDVQEASKRGWIDEIVAPDELISRALTIARALGQHPPAAYAATKEQLHRPARAAIDAGAEMDGRVRDIWLSEETRTRFAAFLDTLK